VVALAMTVTACSAVPSVEKSPPTAAIVAVEAPTLDQALLRVLQQHAGPSHALRSVGDRAVGVSPRMNARVAIDGAGAVIDPEGDDVPTLRLGVAAWGCVGAEAAVTRGALALKSSNRATLERRGFDEWF